MKKNILIVGKNSYIGTSFKNWIIQNNYKYDVEMISARDDKWRYKCFSVYDVVLHVAGIAHMKENKNNRNLYFEINRDLAIEVSKKSKNEGVKHFILLSSMSVYGIEQGIITSDTKENPKNSYGISKLEADKVIKLLEDEDFKVTILRPPMVYGKHCKGNYSTLKKLTNIIPVFPKINNYRSMIYIDNLSEFIKIVIEREISGILCPQNNEYVCTNEMIKNIRATRGKLVYFVPGFNYIINLLSKKINIIAKVFGSLVYDKSISDIGYNYQILNFEESIRRSI